MVDPQPQNTPSAVHPVIYLHEKNANYKQLTSLRSRKKESMRDL